MKKLINIYWLVHDAGTTAYKYFLSISVRGNIIVDIMFGRQVGYMTEYSADGMQRVSCAPFMIRIFRRNVTGTIIFPRPVPLEIVYDEDWNELGMKKIRS